MPFDVLRDCTTWGPALPEPFLQFELERELTRTRLLTRTVGAEGRKLLETWETYRRKLRALDVRGGALRVRHHVIDPLVEPFGYTSLDAAPEVNTREGSEDGGFVLKSEAGTAQLRVWSADLEEDLDAPARRGAAYRYSRLQIARRVLLATGERLGLLTNGVELRILISDPARPDSHLVISLDAWRRSRGEAPGSFRALLALASPAGVAFVPELVEKARLQQVRVTRELRVQARQAVERFVQEVLDHPYNQDVLASHGDRAALARQLWNEGLVVVYRLLFTLKLEATDDPARSFTFASTSLWRNSFSPSTALARHARAVLDEGADTGRLLEDGVRTLFRVLSEGLKTTELNVRPLGGSLFGMATTPLLESLCWGERGVAHLLDRLLWAKKRATEAPARVHYGPLDVEDLGRVYEALLELEPGISTEPMCRLRRQKLEVVVPLEQGERYRPAAPVATVPADEETDDEVEDEESDNEVPTRGQRTSVEWIEEIPAGRFFLRVGLGRKSTGSYYTPHSFVRFLVQETLGPQVAARSPNDNPRPLEILKLKVLDPAMGSGHFLVEACRFLGAALYEACRLCDERALQAERRAESATANHERETAMADALAYRGRVIDLPDPEDELVKYLPSRAPEGEESGLSQRKAEALCRRLVAVHCLYGVDKNPLAVALAKLSLWIESHAEGLPLTFLDHRLVVGNSITGPLFEHLQKYPGSQQRLDDLFSQGLRQSFTNALASALAHVRDLEATIGGTLAEVQAKQTAKSKLDRSLAPFRIAAASWAGGVMVGDACDDHSYRTLLEIIAVAGDLPPDFCADGRLLPMISKGLGVEPRGGSSQQLLDAIYDPTAVPALPFDLVFPDVFFPEGRPVRHGFDAVLGNPPWDAIQFKSREFLAAFDFAILDAPTRREAQAVENRILSNQTSASLFAEHQQIFDHQKRTHDALYDYQKVEVHGELAGRQLDAFRVFMERNAQLLGASGRTGVVVPSAFHANAGATGIRQLYLERMTLEHCYSFENRRKLFEIDSRFKFANVVARRGGPTDAFHCAFYLHDDDWLFRLERHVPIDRNDQTSHALRYTLTFVRKTGGDYLSLLELRSSMDLSVAQTCFQSDRTVGQVCLQRQITMQGPPAALHMSHESHRFEPTALTFLDNDVRELSSDELLNAGRLILYEGKHFWQFDDRWEAKPRYVLPISKMHDLPTHVRRAQYFQLVLRAIAASTNERTCVACILTPMSIVGHSVLVNSSVGLSTNANLLALVALLNAFPFDWLLRQMVASNVPLFVLRSLPCPIVESALPFLAHNALRLTCNHAKYAALWHDQLGLIWREHRRPLTWPVLEKGPEELAVRAATDAVIAMAYGLSSELYRHLLASFNHQNQLDRPTMCLRMFDELQRVGLDAFVKVHDPYWDVPVNSNVPQPTVDLSAALDVFHVGPTQIALPNDAGN